MAWYPHVTVATLVAENDKFLMVIEKNENGDLVYNQPAGHLDQGETLVEAAIRETLEETGWDVAPTAVLGQQLFTAPINGITYLRTNFVAEARHFNPDYIIDSDIESAVWLTLDEIHSVRTQWRSHLVGAAINAYQSGKRYPLEMLDLK
ncbi:NUDIX hydrolase [Aurantivibrio plasticivorans]